MRLPKQQTLTTALSTTFNSLYEQVLTKAKELFLARAKERDITAPIFDKMPFGDWSFATFIFHKASRVCQMMQSPEGLKTLKINDELMDIIVYCATFLAYRRMRQQQDSKEA